MNKVRKFVKQIPFIVRLYRRHIYPLTHRAGLAVEVLESAGTFDTVIDVGANVGTFSRNMIGRAKHIYAFEPIPANVEQIRMMQYPEVVAYAFALGAAEGKGVIRVPHIKGLFVSGLATLSEANRLETSESITSLAINIVRFDDLPIRLNHTINLIKIDVEGYEYSVLEGMVETIDQHHPIFLIEIEKRHNPEYQSVFRFLEHREYLCFFTRNGRMLERLTDYSLERLQDCENHLQHDDRKYVNNFLFLRTEHLGRFTGQLYSCLDTRIS